MKQNTYHTIVAGAGVSGIRAALDLAETGHRVLLLDRSAAHGGILPQLDYQFPNNHCGMCRMLPMIDRDAGSQNCLKKNLSHDNITLLPASVIEDVSGTPGNLSVKIKTETLGINPESCIHCGNCESVCPVEVPDIFNSGYGTRKAVYFPVPFQIPAGRSIDFEACTKCGACAEKCPTSAINLEDKGKETIFKGVGSVILATGTEPYDPEDTSLYGYRDLENVVTSTGFERLFSSSGPGGKNPVRPSDGKPVKSIAWLQCVGSRNIAEGADYCSSACCMISVKEALVAVDKIGSDLSASIFYMDMRTYGRDFQRYRDEAEEKKGINFIRCRAHSIEPVGDSGDLKISYVDEKGQLVDGIYDLAVLATGKRPGQKHPDYAAMDGVFTTSESPEFKEISESVVRACAASMEAAAAMPQASKKDPAKRPQQSLKAPDILTFLCDCSIESRKISNINILAEKTDSMPGAIRATVLGGACSKDGWNRLVSEVKESGCNRLIIGTCNGNLFEGKKDALESETGIPKAFIKTISLQPGELEVSIGAIRTTASKLRIPPAPSGPGNPVKKSVLVVGSGPSGLSAAKALAETGISVDMVEISIEAGGNIKNIYQQPARGKMEKLLAEVSANPNITIHTGSTVKRHSGRPGQFMAEVSRNDGTSLFLPHGAAILATGGERKPHESQGSQGPATSLFDLEAKLHQGWVPEEGNIVMLQCSGSREEPDNYCSRICCSKALECARKIKDVSPASNVTIFYRDMMTTGESEKDYTEARKAGIRFIPFSKSEKPEITINGETIAVKGFNPALQEEVVIETGLLCHSTGLSPFRESDIPGIFGIKTTCDGFLQEADFKWRPNDSGREGIFISGLCRAPQGSESAANEGLAAAQRAMRILSRETITAPAMTAHVRNSICSRCRLCIEACPYGARFADKDTGEILVDPASCQGCGSCASVCPNSATITSGFEDQGVMQALENLF